MDKEFDLMGEYSRSQQVEDPFTNDRLKFLRELNYDDSDLIGEFIQLKFSEITFYLLEMR